MLAFQNSRGLAGSRSRGAASRGAPRRRCHAAACHAAARQGTHQQDGAPTAAPAQSPAQQAPQSRLAGAVRAGAVMLQRLALAFTVACMFMGLVAMLAQPAQVGAWQPARPGLCAAHKSSRHKSAPASHARALPPVVLDRLQTTPRRCCHIVAQALGKLLSSKLEKPSWLGAVGALGAAVAALYCLVTAYVAGASADVKADVAEVKAGVTALSAKIDELIAVSKEQRADRLERRLDAATAGAPVPQGGGDAAARGGGV
jgi:hypothetical protein